MTNRLADDIGVRGASDRSGRRPHRPCIRDSTASWNPALPVLQCADLEIISVPIRARRRPTAAGDALPAQERALPVRGPMFVGTRKRSRRPRLNEQIRDNTRDNIQCVHYVQSVHEPARFGRSGRPWKHLHGPYKVEGLVDRMVRGSSSLLGRTGKAPHSGAFSMAGGTSSCVCLRASSHNILRTCARPAATATPSTGVVLDRRTCRRRPFMRATWSGSIRTSLARCCYRWWSRLLRAWARTAGPPRFLRATARP